MEILGSDNSDERLKALEKKIRDMEALAKGLIDETLDLKSAMMARAKVAEEASRQELRRAPVVRSNSPASAQPAVSSPAAPSEGCIVIQPKNPRPADSLPVADEPKMALIMQTDGTMKMEPRKGDSNQTDSTGGYGPDRLARLSRKNTSR